MRYKVYVTRGYFQLGEVEVEVDNREDVEKIVYVSLDREEDISWGDIIENDFQIEEIILID